MTLFLDDPAGVAPPQGAYSHSVEVPAGAGLVFVSGQVPTGLDGMAPATLAEQADQAFANLVAVLAARRVSPDAIVKLTTFLTEPDTARVTSQARARHLGSHRPASTVIRVAGLIDPAWKIEVEAVALAHRTVPGCEHPKDLP